MNFFNNEIKLLRIVWKIILLPLLNKYNLFVYYYKSFYGYISPLTHETFNTHTENWYVSKQLNKMCVQITTNLYNELSVNLILFYFIKKLIYF